MLLAFGLADNFFPGNLFPSKWAGQQAEARGCGKLGEAGSENR